jgi:hypothetical protein
MGHGLAVLFWGILAFVLALTALTVLIGLGAFLPKRGPRGPRGHAGHTGGCGASGMSGRDALTLLAATATATGVYTTTTVTTTTTSNTVIGRDAELGFRINEAAPSQSQRETLRVIAAKGGVLIVDSAGNSGFVADGMAGATGANGADGHDGAEGRPGAECICSPGEPGPTGTEGQRGRNGRRGEKGDRGDTGPAGPMLRPEGLFGNDGKSSENEPKVSFESESEKVSLRDHPQTDDTPAVNGTAKFARGERGEVGATGAAGPEGFSLDVTGVTGGVMIISEFNVAFIPAGTIGPTGPRPSAYRGFLIPFALGPVGETGLDAGEGESGGFAMSFGRVSGLGLGSEVGQAAMESLAFPIPESGSIHSLHVHLVAALSPSDPTMNDATDATDATGSTGDGGGTLRVGIWTSQRDPINFTESSLFCETKLTGTHSIYSLSDSTGNLPVKAGDLLVLFVSTLGNIAANIKRCNATVQLSIS